MTYLNAFGRALSTFVADSKRAHGANFGGFSVNVVDGSRVLNILDVRGRVLTDVSMDDGDTFHHPSSRYFVGHFEIAEAPTETEMCAMAIHFGADD